MGDKTLTEVIDYDTHIKPYRIAEIVSGMGSGKNYWVENSLMKEKRVLLITSRKAKVNETKNRANIGSCLDLTKRKVSNILYQLSHGKEYGSCVCNNWQIEHYMKEHFIPGNEKTYLWNFFDIIILDEAHSLATDATFADAPFYVLDFLRAVYKHSDKPIVLMTATPAPIDGLLQLSKPEKYKIWDFTEECRCITPERIWHQPRQYALEMMARTYNNCYGERSKVVYFATKITTIANKIIPFLISAGVPEEVIAVSFSENEKTEKFSKKILSNKKHTETYLSEHEDLPSDIYFFFTTSRNKEGINIANPNIYWDVYIESHWKEEAMQMWGRFREGKTQEEDKTRSPINQLTFIDDASQHQTVYCERDWQAMISGANKDIVNTVLDHWCDVHCIAKSERWSNEKSRAIILDTQKTFPYLRFSITNNKFYDYKGRLLGISSFTRSVDRFADYVNSFWGWGPQTLSAENPFEDIPSFFLMPPDKQEQFENYAREKGFLNGTPLSPKDQDELLTYLSESLMIRQKSNPNKKYATLSKAVSEFGYKLPEYTKHSDHPMYGYRKLVKTTAGEDFLDTI